MRPSLFIAGLLVGMAGTVWAHVGERVIPIYELSDEDVAQVDLKDGYIEEWQNIIGEPSLTALDFSIAPQIGDGPSYDAWDLDFRVWLGWNQAASRIYVAIESSDNVYINQYKGSGAFPIMTSYDSVQFMVDGDHSGGEYGFFQDDFSTEEEWRQAFQTQAQQYFAIARTPDSRHVDLQNLGGWYTSPPYVEGGGGVLGEVPTVSVIEFYVTPFDRLVKDSQEETEVSVLFPGKVIGFAMLIGDFDVAPQAIHGSYRLPPQNRVAFTADLFADGVLVGVDGKVPEVSVVESDSWARIKASFGR